MVTYQDLSPSDALCLYREGKEVETRLNKFGSWTNVVHDLWDPKHVIGQFRLVVEEEKIIRYDWQEPSLPAEEAVGNFQSEEEALSVLQGSVDEGACDGEEYIIYKITYEPVKRLRVKINTTLEEIQ